MYVSGERSRQQILLPADVDCRRSGYPVILPGPICAKYALENPGAYTTYLWPTDNLKNQAELGSPHWLEDAPHAAGRYSSSGPCSHRAGSLGHLSCTLMQTKLQGRQLVIPGQADIMCYCSSARTWAMLGSQVLGHTPL